MVENLTQWLGQNEHLDAKAFLDDFEAYVVAKGRTQNVAFKTGWKQEHFEAAAMYALRQQVRILPQAPAGRQAGDVCDARVHQTLESEDGRTGLALHGHVGETQNIAVDFAVYVGTELGIEMTAALFPIGRLASITDDLNDVRRARKLAAAAKATAPQLDNLDGARHYKFWDDPIEVGGRRVYRRGDLFDPYALDDAGLTNLQRMQKGRAPIGFDRESVNLHHLTQREPGAMAEVAGTFHVQNTTTVHHLTEPKRSFRYSADGAKTEAEKAFDRWKYRYWKNRAKDF